MLLAIVATVAAISNWQKINFVSTAQAAGDLSINWGVPLGNPIFNIPNMLPGDVVPHTVIISNGATATRPLGVRGIKISGDDSFASILQLVIKENGNPIYTESLSQFFADSVDPNFFHFADLGPGNFATYVFQVTFPSSAGNEFKSQSIVFDIVIGIAFDLPERCIADYSDKVIFGTSKSENLNGTPKNDIILAFEGDDKVEGNNGDDCIIGGPDNDRLNGNNGEDVIFGEEGNDKLYGNNQDDYLDGGDGVDRAEGNNGADTCDAETELHCEL